MCSPPPSPRGDGGHLDAPSVLDGAVAEAVGVALRAVFAALVAAVAPCGPPGSAIGQIDPAGDTTRAVAAILQRGCGEAAPDRMFRRGGGPAASTVPAMSPRVRLAALVICAAVLAAACVPAPAQRSAEQFPGARCQVGVVGDSLTVGARDFGGLAGRLAARGCEVTAIDAVQGRSTSVGADVVERWTREGRLPRILVVALGTNDCNARSFSRSAQRIMAAAGGRPVVWVNTWRVGCDGPINAVIGTLPGAWVLDHHGWVAAHVSVLSRDGVHLNAGGYAQHAERIANKVTTGLG